MRWRELTKKELKHLREVAGCRSLAAFKLTAASQKEMRENNAKIGLDVEPCWDCKFIARKLGLEV